MRSVLYSFTVFVWCICLSFAISGQTAADPAPADYRIQQGDKLSVKFFTNPELNEASLTVRPDGFITLQLINEVRAAGLTVAELKSELQKRYDELLLEPIITVTLIDFVAPHIFVAGEVGKPGRYDLRDARTIMQAVFIAGGFTKDANKSMVVLARPDGKGDWTIRSANLMKMINAKGGEKDISLLSGDHIYVPESKLSQFNRIVETVRGVLPRIY